MDFKFAINYHSGFLDFVRGSLGDAKEFADSTIRDYMKKTVSIEVDGIELSRREWHPTLEGIETCMDPIQFGKCYFGNWIDNFTRRNDS